MVVVVVVVDLVDLVEVGLVFQRTDLYIFGVSLVSTPLGQTCQACAGAGVQVVWLVAGSNDQEAIRLAHPVHQGEELGHHTVLRC